MRASTTTSQPDSIPRASGQLGARGVFVLELRLQVRGNEDDEGSQQKSPRSMAPRGAMSPYGSAVVHPGSIRASPGEGLSLSELPDMSTARKCEARGPFPGITALPVSYSKRC
jgi:hypothetical protein